MLSITSNGDYLSVCSNDPYDKEKVTTHNGKKTSMHYSAGFKPTSPSKNAVIKKIKRLLVGIVKAQNPIDGFWDCFTVETSINECTVRSRTGKTSLSIFYETNLFFRFILKAYRFQISIVSADGKTIPAFTIDIDELKHLPLEATLDLYETLNRSFSLEDQNPGGNTVLTRSIAAWKANELGDKTRPTGGSSVVPPK